VIHLINGSLLLGAITLVYLLATRLPIREDLEVPTGVIAPRTQAA
ncbi:MAG: hypothetical protein HC915_09730, partial [Anaerolineae bacterium]|nr:hypothetical protein [Anaerolineae bacterium]